MGAREGTRAILSIIAQAELDVELLEGVKASQHTGTSHATENVGAGSLEEGAHALVLEHLSGTVHGAPVLDGLARGHHHAPPDGIDGVGSQTGDHGDTVTHTKGQDKVVSQVSGQEDGLQGIVETKVEATVDNDAHARDDKATVEAADAVGGHGLLVHVDQAVEFARASAALASLLGIVGQPGTSVIQRIHKQQGRGTSSTTSSQVASKPHPVAVGLLPAKQGLEVILEGKVESLGGEITQHIGHVTPPQGTDTFFGNDAPEAIHDAGIGPVQAAHLDHLVLVLDIELDPLNGSSSRLGHGSSNTTKHEIFIEGKLVLSSAREHAVHGSLAALLLGIINALERR
mmetsp:Transcript_131922/g.186172  ORF Transcript_131922/g.186172 Transcript_131922/m.186172 type:complete len:344 (+) Transcript_131922:16-1047(+)